MDKSFPKLDKLLEPIKKVLEPKPDADNANNEKTNTQPPKQEEQQTQTKQG